MKTIVRSTTLDNVNTPLSVGQVLVRNPEPALLLRSTGTVVTQGDDVTVEGVSPSELASERNWPIIDPIDETGSQAALDEYHFYHSDIFRYFFNYPSDLKDFVWDFASAARVRWQRAVQAGSKPNEWAEHTLSDGTYMLEFDIDLPGGAGRYGRQERAVVGAREDLGGSGLPDGVTFTQILNPDIDWSGWELTSRNTDAKKLFEPGDLYQTNLGLSGFGEQLTREDLFSYLGTTINSTS